MCELSKQEKIEVIKSCGIDYVESKYSVQELYEACLIKELIAPRLKGRLDCFGYNDPEHESCKKCYVNKNGTCKKMQDYLEFFRNFKHNSSAMLLTSFKHGVVAMEDIETILKKLNLREHGIQLKIARLILESNDSSFNVLIEKIRELLGAKGTTSYAKVRFYQTKLLLEKKADLEIQMMVQKYIHFRKKVRVDVGPNPSSTPNQEIK